MIESIELQPNELNPTAKQHITNSNIHNKVVKRLSVNRLPVKLPITGFNFQLPITDLPTFFFK